jgi:hypothetical protein
MHKKIIYYLPGCSSGSNAGFFLLLFGALVENQRNDSRPEIAFFFVFRFMIRWHGKLRGREKPISAALETSFRASSPEPCAR